MTKAAAWAVPLKELAAHADRIREVAAPSPCAFSPPNFPITLPISRPHESTSKSDTLARLQADVADLTQMVAALRTSRQFHLCPGVLAISPDHLPTHGIAPGHRPPARHLMTPAIARHTPALVDTITPSKHAPADTKAPAPGRLASRSSTSHLFYIIDKTSGRKFLVDTAAKVSVLPVSRCEHLRPSLYHLRAVNNTSIRIYAERSLILNKGLRRPFPWIFLIVDIDDPILDADF